MLLTSYVGVFFGCVNRQSMVSAFMSLRTQRKTEVLACAYQTEKESNNATHNRTTGVLG